MKTLVKYFWIFILGSLIGCGVEELWCYIKNKCFQIRSSLLHLPLIPVYGMATLFMILILDFVGYDKWKIFVVGVIVATTFEYLFSFVQEKIFHTKSWDYSDFKYNLNGRVNLVYSFGFGVIALLIVENINKIIYFMGDNISKDLLLVITIIVFILFVLDSIISSGACYRQRKRREGIEANNIIDKYFDRRYPDEKLDKVYNNSLYVG